MTGVKCVVVAAAVLAAVTACTVDGDPERAPDLSDRVVHAESFPYGPGTPVPASALPGAVADVTFRPLRSSNDPEDCTPAPVDVAGAHAVVGPGGAAGGTLTVLLTRASDSRDDFVARLCSTFRLGGTVGTTVSSSVQDPHADPLITRRDLASNGTAYAHVYEIVRQQGSVRLYVQNRYPAAVLSPEEMAATTSLFDAASKAAFGS